MKEMKVASTWTVGEYTFEEIVDHGFSEWENKSLFRFFIDGHDPLSRELYESLDFAMVAAVGEKWTGSRRAGGCGVDTAAGWFMRMIGAESDATEE